VSAALDVGSEIGQYRIEDLLGQGGMGVVFRARHVTLDRIVAVKVLGPWLQGNRWAKERFLRESRLAAELEHPNIVTVYDAGEDQGYVYIALRLVDGVELHDELEHGPLEPGRALRVLDQIASALDAAHAAGLVHRDVKPGNILLEGDRAFLTDFGLTRRPEADEDLTRAGEFMGTLDWAAPEQIEPGSLGPPTDVYALGCVLFTTLTGRLPYPGDSPAAAVQAHLHAPAPKIAEQPALQPVIDRALAKAPEDRFQSAGELMDAAHAALGHPRDRGSGRAVAAAIAPARGRGPRLPWILAGVAAAFAAIAVVLVLVLGGAEEKESAALSTAEYEKAVLASDATLDRELQELEDRGGASGPLPVVLERHFAVRDAVRRNAQRLRELSPPAVVRRDHEVLVDGFGLLSEEVGDAIVAAQDGDRRALVRLDQRIEAGRTASVRQIQRAADRIGQAL